MLDIGERNTWRKFDHFWQLEDKVLIRRKNGGYSFVIIFDELSNAFLLFSKQIWAEIDGDVQTPLSERGGKAAVPVERGANLPETEVNSKYPSGGDTHPHMFRARW